MLLDEFSGNFSADEFVQEYVKDYSEAVMGKIRARVVQDPEWPELQKEYEEARREVEEITGFKIVDRLDTALTAQATTEEKIAYEIGMEHGFALAREMLLSK